MGGMTITEFLEARTCEDEAMARHRPKMSDVYDAVEAAVTEPMRARILAECAAKRAILAAHPVVVQLWWEEQCEIDVCQTCQEDDYPNRFPCPTIEALASVYADHPDYDEQLAL